MELNKITTINKSLGERFNTVDSFIEHINVNYKANPKFIPIYEKRLRSELGSVHDYLLGIFEGKITRDNFRDLLFRTYLILKNGNSIRINISNTLRDYQMHQGIPERFFDMEMKREVKAGKSQSVVYRKFSGLLANELDKYDVYDSYINKSVAIFQDTFNQLTHQFPQYTKKNSVLSNKLKINKGESRSESFNLILPGIERIRKIESLYQYLKQEKLIETTTTSKNFSNLFLGVPVRKKVNWTGNTNHLGYFITKLKEIEILSGIDEKRIWEKTKTCFLIKGKAININNVKTNCNPTDKKPIEVAIALFRKD